MNEGLLDSVRSLPPIPAADMKRRGWRTVMHALRTQGSLLVTNHAHPEAVIVAPEEYARLMAIAKEAEAKAETELDTLRHRFDERLAALNQKNAGDLLRKVAAQPIKLRGKVKAGAGF